MGLAEDVLSATNRFYDVAEARDEMAAVLPELCDLLGADGAVLEVHDRAAGVPALVENARIDDVNVSAYVDDYALISPRLQYGMSGRAPPVSHDGLILTERDMDNDPYYADFLAPMGLRYFVSIDLDPGPGMFGVLSFQYRPSHGLVQRDKLRLAAALRPHLVRAMQRFWRRRRLADADWVMADMRRRFGLTPAEAMLGLAVARGERLKDHAARRGIAIATLHTHYDRLKHKAGCARQADLVALLQRLYPAEPPVLGEAAASSLRQ